jgi:hypothetical protein
MLPLLPSRRTRPDGSHPHADPRGAHGVMVHKDRYGPCACARPAPVAARPLAHARRTIRPLTANQSGGGAGAQTAGAASTQTGPRYERLGGHGAIASPLSFSFLTSKAESDPPLRPRRTPARANSRPRRTIDSPVPKCQIVAAIPLSSADYAQSCAGSRRCLKAELRTSCAAAARLSAGVADRPREPSCGRSGRDAAAGLPVLMTPSRSVRLRRPNRLVEVETFPPPRAGKRGVTGRCEPGAPGVGRGARPGPPDPMRHPAGLQFID